MLPVKAIECPYCGEPIELIIDDSIGAQQYIEDCSVCCRPINVSIAIDEQAEIQLTCTTDSEA